MSDNIRYIGLPLMRNISPNQLFFSRRSYISTFVPTFSGPSGALQFVSDFICDGPMSVMHMSSHSILYHILLKIRDETYIRKAPYSMYMPRCNYCNVIRPIKIWNSQSPHIVLRLYLNPIKNKSYLNEKSY